MRARRRISPACCKSTPPPPAASAPARPPPGRAAGSLGGRGAEFRRLAASRRRHPRRLRPLRPGGRAVDGGSGGFASIYGVAAIGLLPAGLRLLSQSRFLKETQDA